MNESGLPPLYTVALYGNPAAIDFLLGMRQKKIYPKLVAWTPRPCPILIMKLTDGASMLRLVYFPLATLHHQGHVIFFTCAYLGRAADAERLLKTPNLAHATTPGGATALHYAARVGHFNVAQILVRYRAE